LINKDNRLVVCDFGLVAKVVEGSKINGKAGTASTWAPEVAKKEKYDLSADWWSVGIVIYQLMYQRNPFDVMVLEKKENEKDEDLITRKREESQKRLIDDNFPIEYEEETDVNYHARGKGLKGHYSNDLKELV